MQAPWYAVIGLALLTPQFVVPRASSASANPIDGARRIDWSTAGVTGGIPTTRTQCGSTIVAYTGTASTINTAIAACGANTYVLLGAGTFSLSTGVVMSVNNVTLRGGGPDTTFLVFTGSSNIWYNCLICIGNAGGGANGDLWTGAPNIGTWDAGYSVGTNSITVTRTAGTVAPKVNSLLYLHQCNDGLSGATCATGAATLGSDVVFCDDVICSGDPTPTAAGPQKRGNMQAVTVTTCVNQGTQNACSGSGPWTIGISPSIRMPNYASGQNPGAAWYTSATQTGSGLENLSVDNSGKLVDTTSGGSLMFIHVTNGWVKNVRGLDTFNKHIKIHESTHITVRDGYYFDCGSHGSECYGIDTYAGADNLVENNIFQNMSNPMMTELCSGCVFAYNFSINDSYTGTFQQAGSGYHHSIGNAFLLNEGNDAIGLTADNVHGSSNFGTAFRNYFIGRDGSVRNQQTVPVILMAMNRYYNVVGNVLGKSGYTVAYENAATTTTDSAAGNNETTVYELGYSDTDAVHNTTNNGGAGLPNDIKTKSTLLRWGNWDIVNNATRFVNGEVPSGISPYSNPIPSSQALPTSMYLSSKPAFYSTTTWPSIGPDVSGGDITNAGGHAYKIPARTCFETVMGGTFADATAKTFNADSCYPR